jgi:tetratricopeptide (TPR) repeat protein
VAYAALANRLRFLAQVGGAALLHEAFVAAEQAVALDAQSHVAHHALAAANMERGRIEAARQHFLRAVELAPSDSRALLDLSVADFLMGRVDESLHWARKAFPLAPNLPVSYYHVAGPLMSLGADAAAQRWLGMAEQRFPTYHRIQVTIAMLDFVRGREQEALRRLRDAAREQPKNQELQVWLAEMLLLTKSPEARTAMETLAGSAPQSRTYGILSETFRVLHAHLLLEQGQRDRALELLSSALNAAQQQVQDGNELGDVRVELAAIHALQGDAEQAIAWLQKAYDAGFRMPRELRLDPLFQTLRSDPRFEALLKRMDEDIAAMRARVDLDAHPRVPPLKSS